MQINYDNPIYPVQPRNVVGCGVNNLYKTIDPFQRWERTAVGPASIKHLYTGIPNWYPYRTITRPVGTMYESDYSQFHDSGVGDGKRISYHSKIYPLTNRHVRERRIYSSKLLPYADYYDQIKHPISRGGNTLNSTMQNYPAAYAP